MRLRNETTDKIGDLYSLDDLHRSASGSAPCKPGLQERTLAVTQECGD